MTNRVSIFDLKIGVQSSAEHLLSSLSHEWNPYGGSRVATRWTGTTASAGWSHNPHSNAIRASIIYPRLPDAGSVTRGEADLIAGLTAHELGHVLYTCRDTWIASQRLEYPKLHSSLLNGLEDPRIEHAVVRSGRAAGTQQLFNQLATKLLLGALRNPQFDPNDFRQAPFVFAILGRIELGATIQNGDLWSAISPKKRDFFKRGIDVLKTAPLDRSGTAVLLEIVKQLVAELRVNKVEASIPENLINEPQDQNESIIDDFSNEEEEIDLPDADESDEDEFEINEADVPAPDDGDSTGEFGDQSDDEPDSEELEGESETVSGADSADAPQPSQSDEFTESDLTDDVESPEPNIDEEFARINERESQHDGEFSIERQPIVKFNEVDQYSTADGSRTYRTAARDVLPKSSAARRHITELLSAPERNGWDDNQATGRFDRRASSKLLSGYENVFSRRWETEGQRTTVTVLLDLSGSIQGQADNLRNLCIVVGESLESSGVEYDILGFNTDARNEYVYDADVEGKYARSSEGGEATTWSCGIVNFKPLNKRLKDCQSAIGSIKKCIGGSTPTGAATLHCVKQLRKREADKRLLVVITDGASNEGEKFISNVTSLAQRQGVDIIGIGLDIDLTGQYPVSAQVTGGELAGKTAQILVKKLRDNRKGRREL